MRKLTIALILGCIVFAGCNFSKGAKKDLRTGLSYSYNGFRLKDVIMVDANNQRMTDNKVKLNTQMAVVALGVENYALKDDKVFPGMMLLVTDKKGTAIINAADLFEGDLGHPAANAAQLRGDITVAQPMVVGETYHVKMKIWDKVKPENVINAETDLVVE